MTLESRSYSTWKPGGKRNASKERTGRKETPDKSLDRIEREGRSTIAYIRCGDVVVLARGMKRSSRSVEWMEATQVGLCIRLLYPNMLKMLLLLFPLWHTDDVNSFELLSHVLQIYL